MAPAINHWTAWAALLVAALSLTWFASEYEAPTAEARFLAEVERLPIPGSFVANLAQTVLATEPDLAIGVVVALLLWRSGKHGTAAVFAILLVVLPIAQHELKVLIDRPRPAFDVEVLWSQPSSASFPSGHVMSTTVVYGFLFWLALTSSWQPVPKLSLGVLAVAALSMSAVSSVYLSTHWPSDVLGGYAWGLILLLPALWYVRFKLGEASP